MYLPLPTPRAIALLLFFAPTFLAGAEELELLQSDTSDQGVHLHTVRSRYQSDTTQIRVILPDNVKQGERLASIYVLPVETGLETGYGDGVAEILKNDLHNRFRLIYIAPGFSQLPWYTDHPSDAGIQQESYLLRGVIPFVEKFYPVRRQSRHRHLVGYSKSGWGAFTLILRNPHQFGRAAAWDAPMMMDKPGSYGSGPIFGGEENFRHYQVTRLVEQADRSFTRQSRLVLTGYFGNFRQHHVALHELMKKQGVRHQYRDGPQRKHDWHSGWLAESLELLFPSSPAN